MHADCPYTPYTLPTIDFVGGETQDLAFNMFFNNEEPTKGKQPFDMTGYMANLAIVNYINKKGTPIITKPMNIVPPRNTRYETNHLVWYPMGEREDSVCNRLTVTLHATETVNLAGKYIYQISIKDPRGVDIDIPNQGILRIANNINKSFIS